ncbi:MAG: ABC transporter substrate-binding protein [Candidatus Tectomicrobia bacterium]|nr:ABC transporter substrate-binding protein [Candidatus Tectomicrobia bacterium]
MAGWFVLAVYLATAGSAGTARADKVRLAYLPIADHLPYFVAKDRGFFKQEGLEVTAQVMSGGAVQIPAMEGGSLDVGHSNVVSVILAHDKGFDVQFFAPGHPLELEPGHVGAAWLARADDTKVSSIKDLAGKRVAINNMGNIMELGLRALLAKAGVPLNALQIVEIPFPQMNPALLENRVDVIGQVEPFVTLLGMDKKGKALARGIMGGTIGPSWQISGWFSKKSWIDKNTATAAAFIRAMTGALKYIQSHPEEVPALIAANTRMKEDLVRRTVLSFHPTALRLTDLQPVIDAAARLGMITKSFPAKNIIAGIAPLE